MSVLAQDLLTQNETSNIVNELIMRLKSIIKDNIDKRLKEKLNVRIMIKENAFSGGYDLVLLLNNEVLALKHPFYFCAELSKNDDHVEVKIKVMTSVHNERIMGWMLNRFPEFKEPVEALVADIKNNSERYYNLIIQLAQSKMS